MIVTDTLKARAGLSFLYETEPEAEAYLRDELREVIVREGEDIGAFIRRESVYFTRREDNPRHEWIITAYWCPDPREGVEFRGGPNDGKVLPIGGEHTRPPDYFRLPPEYTAPAFVSEDEALIPRTMDVGTYRLAGIDSALDRWVYEYDKH